MHTDTRRLAVMILLGLAALPLPVVHAGNRIDADILLPPDPTSDLPASGPSFANVPTETPISAATPTPVATSTPLPAPVDPPMPLGDAGVEQFVVDLLNQRRAAHGLAPLLVAPELAQAARKHSGDMAENGFTDHAGSDGSDAGHRIAEAGYEWADRGEIIGWGYGGDAAKMVDWWMNCPIHRPIVLDRSFVEVGVGYVSDPASDWGYYWTVDFGRRARVPGG
jgi:uncharacterized protein YkwD